MGTVSINCCNELVSSPKKAPINFFLFLYTCIWIDSPLTLTGGVFILCLLTDPENVKKSLENEGESSVLVLFFYIHAFQLIRHSPSPEVFILCSLCPLTISKNVEITKIVWETKEESSWLFDCCSLIQNALLLSFELIAFNLERRCVYFITSLPAYNFQECYKQDIKTKKKSLEIEGKKLLVVRWLILLHCALHGRATCIQKTMHRIQ